MKEDFSGLSARCNEFVSKLREEQAKEEAKKKEEEAKRLEEERKKKEEEERKREEEEKRREEAKRQEEEEKERQRQEEIAKRKKEMENELARQEAKRKMEEEERERQRDALLARQKAILETLRIQKEEEEKKKKQEEEEEKEKEKRKQEEEEEKKKQQEQEEEKKKQQEQEEERKKKEEEEQKKKKEEEEKKEEKEEEKQAKSQSQSQRKDSLSRDDPSEELKEESLVPSSFTPETWDTFLASETQRIAQLHPAFHPPRGLQSADSGLWTLQDYPSFFPAVFDPAVFALCVYWHLPSSQHSADNLAFLEQNLAEFPMLRVLVVDLSLFPQLLCQLGAAPLSIQCFLFGSLVDSSAEDLQATFLSFARSIDSRYTDYLLDIQPHTSMDPSEFRRRAIQNETFGIYPLMNEIATSLDTLLHNLHIECGDVEKERNALEVGKRKHANRSFSRKCFRTCSTIRTIRNYTGSEEVPKNCASS